MVATAVAVTVCVCVLILSIAACDIVEKVSGTLQTADPNDAIAQRLDSVLMSDLLDEDKVSVCHAVLGTAHTKEGAAEQQLTTA